MAKKTKPDTKWQGSWAQQEEARPQVDRSNDRKYPHFHITGTVLYPCDKDGNRLT